MHTYIEVYVYISGVNKFSRILGTTSRRQGVTGSNFHIKDPQILGGNVKNLFARRLRIPGTYVLYRKDVFRNCVITRLLTHPCCRSAALVWSSRLTGLGFTAVLFDECD